METWFEDLPLDFTRDETRKAEKLLIAAYPMNQGALMLAQNAGLDLASLKQMQPVKFLIHDILEKARLSDRLVQLISEVLRDPEIEAIHEEFASLIAGHEAIFMAAAMRRKPSIATLAMMPPSMEAWGAGPAEAQSLASPGLEKTINAEAGFAEPALFRKHLAEAEIRTARIDIGGKPNGTGFLVADRLILTNWHVVEKVGPGAVARFDHKVSAGGTVVDPGRMVPFEAEWLVAHSPYDSVKQEISAKGPPLGKWDFALVKLAEPAGSQGIGPNPQAEDAEERGHYSLDGSNYDFDEAEPLLIVGHPEGRPIQLSYASPSQVKPTKQFNRLRYHTNTEGGSSGSPVFNRDWRIVALHQATGPTSIPGEFNMQTREFNQGISMSGIVAELRKQLAGKPELAELGIE